MIYSVHSSIATQTRNQKSPRPRWAGGMVRWCGSLENPARLDVRWPVCAGCSPGSLRRTKPPSRQRLFCECSFSLSLFSCLKRLNRGKKCNIHVIHLSSLDWKFSFLCQRMLEQFAGKIIKMKIVYILKSLFLWFLTRPK